MMHGNMIMEELVVVERLFRAPPVQCSSVGWRCSYALYGTDRQMKRCAGS